MKKVSLLIVVTIFILFSCNKENQSNLVAKFSLNDTIQLAFGDSLFNPSEKMYIVFDSVVSDSRCPINANCIWAGTAIADFHISTGIITFPFELATYDVNNYSLDTTINDFEIKLIKLDPYPEIGVERLKEDYKATLIVSKK